LLRDNSPFLKRINSYPWINLLSWIVLGFILFLSGLGHQSILSSAVRNGLFIAIGFIFSQTLSKVYCLFIRQNESIILILIIAVTLSYIAGVLTGLILNPITFIGFRGGLGNEPLRALFAGVLNFGLVYACWSIAYLLFQIKLEDTQGIPKPEYVKRISVKDRQSIFLIDITEILYFEAYGDYIRVHTATKRYLIRERISELIHKLDPSFFFRVHRSIVINSNYLESLQSLQNGDYKLTMNNGSVVKMSRNYRSVLQQLTGE
ncbi:MAG: LytTR family transcriptional regulator, partial [Calditrichaeota bacterium]|nr:LytTR family transcriptional regulator [Calditrichota bacterium]